jgi:hypothetical protein
MVRSMRGDRGTKARDLSSSNHQPLRIEAPRLLEAG